MKDNNNEIPKNEPPRPFPKYFPWSFEGHYQPWYDDRRDYNTNAPSYYDYLAHQKFLSDEAIELINRVARRNIQVEDTNCINFTKTNDWIDEGNPCETWHDIITLKCDVVLSNYQKSVFFDSLHFDLPNSIACLNDGLYSPDYEPYLTHLKNKLNEEIRQRQETDTYLEGRINQEVNDRKEGDNLVLNYVNEQDEILDNKIEKEIKDRTNAINQAKQELYERIDFIQTALQKIVTNLYEGGNATTNQLHNYEIINHIASGNINVYAQNANSNTLIKTHATNTNKTGDIVVGLTPVAPSLQAPSLQAPSLQAPSLEAPAEETPAEETQE